MKTLESYAKKCKNGLVKQFFSILLYTSKSQMRQLCKRDNKWRQKLMNASKCINKGKHEFEKCHIVMIDKLLGIKFAEDQKKIPFTCW